MKIIIFMLYFISGAMVYSSAIYLYSKILNAKPKINCKYLILIILCLAFQAFLQVTNYSSIVPIFTFIWLIIFGKKFFNNSWKETIICLMIVWILLFLIDVLIMFHMNRIELYNFEPLIIQIFKGVSSVTMSIFLILFAKFPFIINGLSKLFKALSNLTVRTACVTLAIVLYFALGTLCYRHMNHENDIVYLIIILLVSVISILALLYLIHLNYEIVVLKSTNDIIEHNNETLLKTLNEYRIMKYNINNKLLGIKSVGNKDTRIMINEILKEYDSNKYLKSEIPFMPSGLNGFILEKFYAYADKNLKIQIDNNVKGKLLNILGPKNYNLLCEALGVTLDNALESASQTKDKIIFLEFTETEKTVNIKVMNTFKGIIDTEKLGTIEYTSNKLNGHGLGLYSLFNKNTLYITTSIKNNFFRSEIKVDKKTE